MHPFEQKLAASWPPSAWQDVTVLLAVSGGADSVALLRAMAAVRVAGLGRLVVAHYDHALREQAPADAVFVEDLSRRLSLSTVCGRAVPGEIAAAARDGLENAARAARYAFLEKSAHELGARYVCTAHTADDQAETILHRIVRGTGLEGLAGMARLRPLGPAATLVRPLLTFRRAEIRDYLADLGQACREDETNDDLRFTRNRIRRDLLPRLAGEYNAGVTDALLRLSTIAAEVQHVLKDEVERLAARAVKAGQAGAIEFDCPILREARRHLVRELFADQWRRQGWPLGDMSFEHWNELAELAQATSDASATRILPGNVRAARQGGWLVLSRQADGDRGG